MRRRSYRYRPNKVQSAVGIAAGAVSTAAAKCSLSFGDAFLRGVFCNLLVCLAVWMAMAAKDAAGKVAALFFPIFLFVLCGFEHCIANMYYIPAGIFANAVPRYASMIAEAGINVAALDFPTFIVANLIPVTIGNIIGGALVGLVMYVTHSKKRCAK